MSVYPQQIWNTPYDLHEQFPDSDEDPSFVIHQLSFQIYHAYQGSVDDLELRGSNVQFLAASLEALLDVAIVENDFRIVLSRFRSFDM